MKLVPLSEKPTRLCIGLRSGTSADGVALAAKGKLSPVLREFFSSNPYLSAPCPKTTGREMYGQAYADAILALAKAREIGMEDVIASATWFTAEAIRRSLLETGLSVTRLVVGGGSHNKTMLSFLKEMLPSVRVETEEDIGFHSDSKEAVAFDILADAVILVSTLPIIMVYPFLQKFFVKGVMVGSVKG